MRVLHLIPTLGLGGAEAMLSRLVREWSTRDDGPRSIIACLDSAGAYHPEIEQLGVRVHVLPNGRSPGGLLGLSALMRRERPDVLQTWMYRADLAGALTRAAHGRARLVWNIRSSASWRLRGWARGATFTALRGLSGVPDAVISNSRQSIDEHAAAGYRPRRWELIPNGFDVDMFRPMPDLRDTVRARLGLPPTAPVIGMVARLDPVKDHDNFLAAARILAERNHAVHFALIGTGIEEGLAAKVRALGLEERVHLLQPRRDIPEVLAALDLATSSSLSEGFPNVVGEAMACGLPVVSTRAGDVGAMIRDDSFLVPVAQPEALAAAWSRVLDLPAAERAAIGRDNRRHIVENFSIHAIADRYIALYESLVRGGRVRRALPLRLYEQLPHPVRQLAVAGKGAQQRMFRIGAHYHETLALLRETEYWDGARMAEYRRRLLDRLLHEAATGTQWYRASFEKLPADTLRDAVARVDVSALPVVRSMELRRQTAEFDNRLRRGVYTSRTSGSTGTPLVVQYDRQSIQERFAFMHRHREWLGAQPRGRSVRLSGNPVVPSARTRPPFVLRNPFEQQLLVSTYHLHDRYMPSILEAVARFDPEVIEGYPSAVVQLARALAEAGLELPRLKGAIVTAETLEPHVRAEIERDLARPVLNYYAASEGVPLIQECREGRLHLRLESGIFEMLREDGSAADPGEIAELVVTSFVQWKTPLIRYATGDSVRSADSDEPCPCGRKLPYVHRVLGRVEDLVVTPDGRRIGMFSYRTVKHARGIAEAQIVQRTPTAFTVRYVPAGADPERLAGELAELFRAVLGYEPEVVVEPVQRLERGANGKLRTVVRVFDA